MLRGGDRLHFLSAAPLRDRSPVAVPTGLPICPGVERSHLASGLGLAARESARLVAIASRRPRDLPGLLELSRAAQATRKARAARSQVGPLDLGHRQAVEGLPSRRTACQMARATPMCDRRQSPAWRSRVSSLRRPMRVLCEPGLRHRAIKLVRLRGAQCLSYRPRTWVPHPTNGRRIGSCVAARDATGQAGSPHSRRFPPRQ
jgi:hypothetical protein